MGLQGTKERRCWPSKPQDPTSALSVTIFAALQSSMPVALTLKKKISLLRVLERESGRFANLLLLGGLFCQLPLTLWAAVAI